MVRSIVIFDGALLGYLCEASDYQEIGGKRLARAFRDCHVQLAVDPEGEIHPVDDMTSDAFLIIHGAHIRKLNAALGDHWEFDEYQSDGVRAELERVGSLAL